jgi:hypothetical protein
LPGLILGFQGWHCCSPDGRIARRVNSTPQFFSLRNRQRQYPIRGPRDDSQAEWRACNCLVVPAARACRMCRPARRHGAGAASRLEGSKSESEVDGRTKRIRACSRSSGARSLAAGCFAVTPRLGIEAGLREQS